MIRIISACAVAVAILSAPAMAEPATQTDQASKSAQTAVLSDTAASAEARQHLVRQGYVNVSALEKDDKGRWAGTAMKDGKTLFVAIDLRNGAVNTKTN